MKNKTFLKHKQTGIIGTLEYSSFGGSVHYIDYFDGEKIHAKTRGDHLTEIYKYWDLIDDPEGYEINENGWVEKIEKGEN